jgi:hypothetical protein
MRCGARSLMLMIMALACLVNGPASAQDKTPDTMDLLREKIRADKKLVVAAALELNESEAKGFWPVYAAYQSDMITHYDRVTKLVEDYAKVYQTMNDEAATQLLGEFLALQIDHAALLNRYAPKFQRVLPARKVARFYQVENKIRAMLDYQLARDIPLIK